MSLSINLAKTIYPHHAGDFLRPCPSQILGIFSGFSLQKVCLGSFYGLSYNLSEIYKTQTSSIQLKHVLNFILSNTRPTTCDTQPQFTAWPVKAPSSPVQVSAICKLFCGPCQVPRAGHRLQLNLACCRASFRRLWGCHTQQPAYNQPGALHGCL